MTGYRPPVEAIEQVLATVGVGDLLATAAFGAVAPADLRPLLDGFADLAAGQIAPTDAVGDRQGVAYDPASGTVTTPVELRRAWERYVEGGWLGLPVAPAHGGGGMPSVVNLAIQEMFASANLSLSLASVLTQSAVELIVRWGTPDQVDRHVPPLLAGRATATMNITEPDAGSDVGAIATRAEPRSDGLWEITGSKIFITWGEHDLSGDVLHLVLARTPGAPDGTRGLSLFAVPKARTGAPDGNGVSCTAVEHKLGIHASPTCSMSFEGAVGELVGDEHGGMAVMFTMMNAARLAVGVQGLAVTERAYQQALGYASERRQGRAPGGGGSVPIIDHLDVRRMLLDLAASAEGMRLLLYTTAATADRQATAPDPQERDRLARRANLLTPLAKTWPSDEGVSMASIAIQVHGGMGFIEETGIAQRYRDARIAPIYEGTNGIQAIDLVVRKVGRDRGEAMYELVDELRATIDPLVALPGMSATAELLDVGCDALREATSWAVTAGDDRPDDLLAGAAGYTRLASTVVVAGLMAAHVVALHGRGRPEAEGAAARLRFFVVERIPPAQALLIPVVQGASRLDRAGLS